MEWLQSLVRGMPVDWQVFLLSMFPITELRASIPLAVAGFGIPPAKAWALAVAGNLLPAVFLLILLGSLSEFLSRYPLGKRFFSYIFSRTRRQGQRVAKYGPLGVLIFVAVPIPGSGVWAGSALAFLLGLKFWPAFGAIAGGVVVAATLVTLGCVGVLNIFGF